MSSSEQGQLQTFWSIGQSKNQGRREMETIQMKHGYFSDFGEVFFIWLVLFFK